MNNNDDNNNQMVAELARTFGRMVKRGVFRAVVRHVLRHPDPEDRLQDAVCQVWAMYRRYALNKGKVLDPALLVHACRLRAVDYGRSFVGACGRRRCRDVFALTAHRRSHVELLALDVLLEAAFAKQASANPTRELVSALDLQVWLGGLDERDRQMLAARFAGETLYSIAKTMGLSTAGVFRKLRQLGHALALRAGIGVDKEVEAPMARPHRTPEQGGRTHDERCVLERSGACGTDVNADDVHPEM